MLSDDQPKDPGPEERSEAPLPLTPLLPPKSPAQRPRIPLPDTDEALAEECEFTAFRATGPGGQIVNKTDSAVRLNHIPTGIVVTSRSERSQWRNRQICLEKLREKITQLNFREKPRKPTRKSRGVKGREKDAKQRQSAKKKDRRGYSD
jgi:protein subunit release factor B